ncbi:hypothetical protein [Streptomyces sp. NPDC005017]|uniref:hypothetical protein n=1 Tax=Streptomyces sp. NPDC005017 TaxID=3364706 RepID=UPI0036B92A92
MDAAQQSVAAALTTARDAPPVLQERLVGAVQDSFMHGFHVACFAAACICLLGSFAASVLPGRPTPTLGRTSETAKDTSPAADRLPG